MDEFLTELAKQKYKYYHHLYVFKPQAYTNEECLDRVLTKTRFQEVMEIIDMLPVEQERIVDELFEEMKNR
jgi:hypothetical protein